MAMEESKVVRSIRADKEVFARLQEISKEKGMNQGATLEALINAWDIQSAKGLVPERAADIADFDAAVQHIQSAFLRSIELATGAESRARNEYATQLDVMSGEIARLKAELKEAQESAESAAQELATAIQENGRLKTQLKEAQNNKTLEALLTAVAAKLEETPKTAESNAKRKRGAKTEAESPMPTAETIEFPKEAHE